LKTRIPQHSLDATSLLNLIERRAANDGRLSRLTYQQAILHTLLFPINRNTSLRVTPQQDSVSQNGIFSQNVFLQQPQQMVRLQARNLTAAGQDQVTIVHTTRSGFATNTK
jgi:hypothetical protein